MLVQFENILEKYYIDDKYLNVEYVLNATYEHSAKDCIGIFPKGWRKLDQALLLDLVGFKIVGDNPKRRVKKFILGCIEPKMSIFNADYQIIYISKNLQVVGISSYFRFEKRLGDLHSQGDNGGIIIQREACSISPLEQTVVLSPPVSNNSDVEHPLVRPYFSDCVLYQSTDSNGTRYASCIYYPQEREQLALFAQVKEQADTIASIKKEKDILDRKLELSLMTQKRLKQETQEQADAIACLRKEKEVMKRKLELCLMSQKCLKHEKHSYEVFVYQLLECLKGSAPVCVRDSMKGLEMIVQRIGINAENNSGQLAVKHTPLNDCYLKAVIGNQESKIRDLAHKLIELKDKNCKLHQLTRELQRALNETAVSEVSDNMVFNCETSDEDTLNGVENATDRKEIEKIKDDLQDEPTDFTEIPKFTRGNSLLSAVVTVHRIADKMEPVIYDMNNNDGNGINDNTNKITSEETVENETDVDIVDK